MDEHLRREHPREQEEAVFSCDCCDFRSQDSAILLLHLVAESHLPEHLSPGMVPLPEPLKERASCDLCPFETGLSGAMKDHLLAAHGYEDGEEEDDDVDFGSFSLCAARDVGVPLPSSLAPKFDRSGKPTMHCRDCGYVAEKRAELTAHRKEMHKTKKGEVRLSNPMVI